MTRDRGDIEALDRALDLLVAGRRAEPDGRLAPAVAAALMVREALRTEVPAHVAERHVDAIHSLARPQRVHRPGIVRRGFSRRLSVAVAFATAASLSAAGTVAAAERALPGEALYPVKRAAEAVRLTLERDPADRAHLQLEVAARRLDELQRLLAARRAGQDVAIGAAMRAYRHAVSNANRNFGAPAPGRDLQPVLARADTVLGKQVERLERLRSKPAPGRARGEIERSYREAKRARHSVQQRRSSRPQEQQANPPRGNSGNSNPNRGGGRGRGGGQGNSGGNNGNGRGR